MTSERLGWDETWETGAAKGITSCCMAKAPAPDHLLVLPSHMAPPSGGHHLLIGMRCNGGQAAAVGAPAVHNSCPQPPGPLPEQPLLLAC